MMRRFLRATIMGTLAIAAQAWAGQGDPAVKHICAVSPDVLAVEIEAREVVPGRLQPYERQANDRLQEDAAHHQAWINRDGKLIGVTAGKERKLWWNVDRVVGSNIDTRLADEPATYRVSSDSDMDFGAGVRPLAVFRKTKPNDLARTGSWQFEPSYVHVLYLKLPKPLKDLKQYLIDFGPLKLEPAKYVHDPVRVRNEAVHVNQVGFRPDDPVKRAYLSCWMGSGGGIEYPQNTPFEVYDLDNGKSVSRGTAKLGVPVTQPEDAYKNNHNGTNVYWLDFSELKTPGRYCIVVDGIGCSYPFEIRDSVYDRSFYVSARGFYHQRSGIELKPPYTTFTRPRCFSPADGVVVNESTCSLMDSGNGLNAKGTDTSNFGNLVKGATTRVVADAWGGYCDAGDWDRRIQHLDAPRYLLELAELYPNYFANVSLNIPESGNGLPDVVNEALWGLDFYRRMQTPEGGIRGGIEQTEHPWLGETSWLESKQSYAYAPDEWCSYIYAGDAARAAIVLRKLKPELAGEYEQSAIRAFAFGETRTDAGKKYARFEIRDKRNYAAVELWRMTGDAKYHQAFLDTTIFTDPNAETWVWEKQDQEDAAFAYASCDLPGQDPAIKKNARATILKRAAGQPVDSIGFNWTTLNPYTPAAYGALTTPRVMIARAHWLTHDERYLRSLVLDCQLVMGANPVNISYTIGLGQVWPKNPLICDARVGNLPNYPGITVFGPADPKRNKNDFGQKLVEPYTYPAVETWPTTEAFFDVFMYPAEDEFTVMGPMAPHSYVMGYLAARQ